MQPLIGITMSMERDESYYKTTKDNIDAITHAGGMPWMLPYVQENDTIRRFAKRLDGLYLTGGYDIDPILFQEEPHPKLGIIITGRDEFELFLTKQMLQMDKPVFAVCRGCQILNLALGGDMYQDIETQYTNPYIQHQQQAAKDKGSHFVKVVKGSLLCKITESERILVNSRHHQANRKVCQPLYVSGVASDGIIEAVESRAHAFALGVQWHPENRLLDDDGVSINMYQSFVKACQDMTIR